MSELFPVAMGVDGRFGYDTLPLYWSAPGTHFAFLIRCDGRLGGCVLATRGSPASSDPTVLDVTEFFVVRSQRRTGVGRRAAFLLWDRLPGRWVVRVSEVNRAVLPFWETVIRDYTGGRFATKSHRSTHHKFWVFSFTSREHGAD